jgi:hypothetical protein
MDPIAKVSSAPSSERGIEEGDEGGEESRPVTPSGDPDEETSNVNEAEEDSSGQVKDGDREGSEEFDEKGEDGDQSSDRNPTEDEDEEESVVELTDEERRAAIKEREKQEKLEKYINEQCTRITFAYDSGERKEVLLHRLLDDYSALQCEIARLHPKSKKLFVCQFIDGSIIR